MATITVVTTQIIDIPNLGNLIRREIRDRGLTWNQVATAINMGRTTLWRIITGKLNRISSWISEGFKRVLGIDLGVWSLPDQAESEPSQTKPFEDSPPVSSYDNDDDDDDEWDGYVDPNDYYANLTPEQEAELLRMEMAEVKQAANREALENARKVAKATPVWQAPKKAKKAKKNFMQL